MPQGDPGLMPSYPQALQPLPPRLGYCNVATRSARRCGRTRLGEAPGPEILCLQCGQRCSVKNSRPWAGRSTDIRYNILQFTPRGVYSSLLAARRRLTTRHRHSPGPLPARRFLARVGLQPIGVGTARHGGHAPRRRLLRLPLGASLAGPGGGCGPGPSTPGPPTLS